METTGEHIENIYKKRVSLLRELLDCLGRERDSLINQDINGIWSLMDEKNKILESLDESKEHLEELHAIPLCLGDFHPAERQNLTELSKTMSALKQEIKVLVKGNISFINDITGFFHELVTVMTSSGQAECSYSKSSNSQKGSPGLFYRSEV